MILEEPYFMSDPEWYKYDEDNYKYILTDKAPEEAKISYEEYYKLMELNK